MRGLASTPEDKLRLEACSDAVRGGSEVLWEIAEPCHFSPAAGSQAESEASAALDSGLDPAMMQKAWRAIVEFSTACVEHAAALPELLLDQRTVTAPIVVRATIELAQRACWLLEPTASARQRAARAQLEELFSARDYQSILKKLAKGTTAEGPARAAFREARSELRELRAYLQAQFGPASTLEGDPSAWRIEGQELPVLTGTSGWFFLGVYHALPTSSHPTLWRIRANQEAYASTSGDSRGELTGSVDFMEILCATTSSSLYRMNDRLAGYFGWDPAPVREWGLRLNAWSPDLVGS